jgi:hypothetical protein
MMIVGLYDIALDVVANLLYIDTLDWPYNRTPIIIIS